MWLLCGARLAASAKWTSLNHRFVSCLIFIGCLAIILIVYYVVWWFGAVIGWMIVVWRDRKSFFMNGWSFSWRCIGLMLFRIFNVYDDIICYFLKIYARHSGKITDFLFRFVFRPFPYELFSFVSFTRGTLLLACGKNCFDVKKFAIR